MLSHVSLGVHDLQRTRRFYDAVMATLGASRVWTGDTGLGYGTPGFEQLNLFLHGADVPVVGGQGFHLAFVATDPDVVRAFHAAAIAHGGTCEGPPGLREHYGPGYFAAFVRDPDGHKLECHVRSAP